MGMLKGRLMVVLEVAAFRWEIADDAFVVPIWILSLISVLGTRSI